MRSLPEGASHRRRFRAALRCAGRALLEPWELPDKRLRKGPQLRVRTEEIRQRYARAEAARNLAMRWLSENHAPEYTRSEEHTSELQSRPHLVCRLLLEKKKK